MPRVRYCDIVKDLNPETLQSWQLKIDNKTAITTFNPLAHFLSYMVFVPGYSRKKDMKIRTDENGNSYSRLSMLLKFANASIEAGRAEGIDFQKMYQDWFNYIRFAKKEADLITKIKMSIIVGYWETIGTHLSHGTDLPSRVKDKIAATLLRP